MIIKLIHHQTGPFVARCSLWGLLGSIKCQATLEAESISYILYRVNPKVLRRRWLQREDSVGLKALDSVLKRQGSSSCWFMRRKRLIVKFVQSMQFLEQLTILPQLF